MDYGLSLGGLHYNIVLVIMAIIILLCLCALVIVVLSSYAILQLITDNKYRHLPPGPWPLPVIGNILNLSKLLHRSLAHLAEHYGPLMTIRLGTSLCIVASSPSTAREILQRHNSSLCGRNPADAWRGAGHGDNSIFVLQPHNKWRLLRRLGTTHLFSPRRLEELQPLRQDAVRALLQDVLAESGAASGSLVSIRRVTYVAMVNLLWRAIFSNELDETTAQGLYDCMREAVTLIMTPNISDLFPVLAEADLQGVRRRMTTLLPRGYQLIDRQIDQRLRARQFGSGNHTSRPNDFLDVMLDMWEEQQQHHYCDVTINRDLMRVFFMDLFVGASDTSSNTIEWALAELLHSPKTMRNLQQELKTVLGSKAQVEDSDIDKLPYLQAFEWTLPEQVERTSVDMTEKFGLVLSMRTPLLAIAKKKM
ncbi:hypothetical protein PR202_gb07933 [Eleusine coracana subsp. coracana]|uniref:Uncharacterized protein n=1 Tax=Eleusine coracana subsp. coracana TaxID=191504 RepID=A0AAV5EDD5_ELECO|nr:hypothetical protein PR202_gb07933 [Eleusine coracana subsp. coracana]